jgi:general secretion pathway protein N
MSGSNRQSEAGQEAKTNGAARDIHMVRVQRFCMILAAMFAGLSSTHAEDAAVQTPVAPQALANPVAATSFEQLSATREKPLFTPDRHLPVKLPVVTQAAPPPPPPAAPPQVSLLGVVVDANGPRAVIRSDPAGKNVPVRLGDDVAGWRVTEIEGQRLVISLDDRSFAVKLFGSDHGGQPVPIVHPQDRVLEVNAAGVLRAHRIHHAQ